MEEFWNDYPWPDGEYVHWEPMGEDGPILKEEEVKPDVTTPKGILDMREVLIKLHKK